MIDQYKANSVCNWLCDAAELDPVNSEDLLQASGTIVQLMDHIKMLEQEIEQMKPRWNSSANPPEDEDEMVLVQATGMCDGCTFDSGYALATYSNGWHIEDVPGGEQLTVEAWMPLPEIWEGDDEAD